MPDRLDYAIRSAEKQVNMCIQTGSVNVCCQGDREGRPGNRRLQVKQAIWYCRGDPRGRPGSLLFQSAISSCFAVKRCRQHTQNGEDQHYPRDTSQRSEYADEVDDCKRGHYDEHTYKDNHVTDDEVVDGFEGFHGRTSSSSCAVIAAFCVEAIAIQLRLRCFSQVTRI